MQSTQRRAVEALKRAVRYEYAGSVRAAGIEALHRHMPENALPWIRNALNDHEPGVQFAALIALGECRDRVSVESVRRFADDKDPNLRVAAYYALHRLGDPSHTARLPELLLNNPSADVRRNTALVLGLLGEPAASKLLVKGAKDDDESVATQALESLALLHHAEAISQLTFSASGGMPVQRVTAINTLAELRDAELAPTFRYQLESGEYIETRLAAARALALLGNNAGFDLAMKSLGVDSRQVVIMAAAALGAMHDDRSLAALGDRLESSDDPYIQVAVADAILAIAPSRGGGPAKTRTVGARRLGGSR